MINGIEIIINQGANYEKNVFIVPTEKQCYYNNKKYNITDIQIENILKLLTTWKYEYGCMPIIDAEEFNVIVYSNDGKTTYHGKGIYPYNYSEFKSIIGDVTNE